MAKPEKAKREGLKALESQMTRFENNAVNMWGPSEPLKQPVTVYVSALDCLLFLREDCSYRAEYVDCYLTVLWHPHEKRLVGLKLTNCRFVFRQIMRAMHLKEDSVISLASALEIVMLGGVVEIGTDGMRSRTQFDRHYSAAFGVVADVEVRIGEVLRNAASPYRGEHEALKEARRSAESVEPALKNKR